MDPINHISQSLTPKRAVVYLRVSRPEQARRGGHEEGFSIPAQREANRKKAQSLGAMVVKEFVEGGVTGTSMKRPALQAMLTYLEEERGNVDYIIVHKIDRLARNRADDAHLGARFEELGVRLVSTSENIDQTPSGMLLHGIMSSIAEFYSRNLANEVLKGMNQKVASGGTVSRAPIGYLNTRSVCSGDEVRTVTLDEVRAPLVAWAFEEYAKGDISVRSLAAALRARGLTTVPTRKFAAKPVSTRHVHQMLQNRYYLGVIRFAGAEYPGSHPPLVTPEVFEQVQAMLEARRNGTRHLVHDHFLKGLLFCGRCGGRMIIQKPTNHAGVRYEYFVCNGRMSRRTGCTMRAVPIWFVEQQVEILLRQMELPSMVREQLEQRLGEELMRARAGMREEREQLGRELQDITAKQQKLLEAHYHGALPVELLGAEQARLETARLQCQRLLDAHREDDAEADELLGISLKLAADCYQAFVRASLVQKRQLCRLFFARILVHEDGSGEQRVGAEVGELWQGLRVFPSPAAAGAADGADDGDDVTAVADEIEANEGRYPHSVVYSTSLYSNSNNGPEKLDMVTRGGRGQAGELAASRKAQPDQKVADLSTKTAPKHTKKPTNPGQMGGGLCVNRMVGLTGFEPATP